MFFCGEVISKFQRPLWAGKNNKFKFPSDRRHLLHKRPALLSKANDRRKILLLKSDKRDFEVDKHRFK